MKIMRLDGIYGIKKRNLLHYQVEKWLNSLANRGKVSSRQSVLVVYNKQYPERSLILVDQL